jgi:preprotein translocase subunit YajC
MIRLLLALPAPDAPPDPGPSGGGGFLGQLFPLLLVLVVVMLFMPLFSRKERDRKKRLGAVKKHDRIVTAGGVFGTITSVDDQVVTLEVARDVRIKIKRSSIFDIERPTEGKAEAKS